MTNLLYIYAVEDLKNFVPNRPAHNGSQQKTAQQYSDEQTRKLDLLAMKHKRHETRERVVEELVQTEHDYLQSLCVCLEVFFAGSTRSVCSLICWSNVNDSSQTTQECNQLEDFEKC
jgi:hypothetical protein